DAAPLPIFLKFEKDAGRAEDMPSIDECGAQTWRNRDGLAVGRSPAEIIEAVQRVCRGIERLAVCVAAACRLSCARARIFFLQMSGIEHHEACKFSRRRGGDDFAVKTA